MSTSMAGSNPIEEPLLFAQQFWRAALDALPSQVAILDSDGKIIEVNQGWRNFADANGYRGENYGLGSNYLETCERAVGICEEGHAAAQGIRAVFSGAQPVFTLEYPCHSPVEKRWFQLRVTRFTLPGHTYALVEHQNVTAQKLASNVQLEQRQWLQATLTSIGDAVLATDAQGRVIFLNRVAEELTGWQQAEAKGVPLDIIFRIINEETRQPVENPVTRVLSEGKIMGLANHTAIVAKDGTERPIDDSAAPIVNEQGQVNGAVLVFRDISERKRGEQRRNARLAVTKTLAEATTLQQAVPAILQAVCERLNWDVGAFWCLDPQANRLRCLDVWQLPAVQAAAFVEVCRNAAFATGEGIPGRVWASAQPVWVPDVLCDENFPRATIAAGVGLHGAFAAPIMLGSDFLGVIEFFSHEFREPDADLLEMMHSIGGQIGQFMERKRAEEAQTFLASIVESSDDAIIGKTLDGTILSWNKGAERIYGYSAEESVGQSISMLIPTSQPDDLQHITEQLKRGEAVDHFETVRMTKDGRLIDVSLTISPLRDEYNRVAAASVIARDITKSKRAEAMLREADRRKDEFLAMLAHELRNPLAPIRNSIEILSLRGTDTDVVNQTREVIDRQVQQMTRMVDDLLDVSRITRGKVQLKKEPSNLTDIIKAAVETSRPLIESRHHRLTVDLGNDSMYLEADFARLAQVLTNLLNNAAKYTEVGGQIWVTAEHVAGEFVVRVRDTGIGIAPEALPQVFDLFTQEERSLDRAQGGLGIGLTLARRLVEMHGGTIEASSAGRGRGSEFIVRLPAPIESAVNQSIRTDKAQPSVASRKRILVVDDNADSAESLAMLLSIWGHEVVIAHNGLSGIEQAEAHSPEVVFLDIGLPQLDGYEVAQRLQQHADLQNTLLIAMTGYGQEEDRRRTREAGFHHHLVKPIDFDKLEELLASSARATG